MTWKKVIIFAAASGIVTGIIMQIPLLDGTSIQNIGITLEAWILFAVIICCNCKTPKEAALKTFVFFLISQPLVYLTMWPVYHSFPWNYYHYWFYMTIATLPGGFIAWHIKKNNPLAAIILSVATSFLVYTGIKFGVESVLYGHFPKQILAAVFCIAQAAILILVILKNKKEKLLAGAITIIAAIALSIMFKTGGVESLQNYPVDGIDETTVIILEDASLADITPSKDTINIACHKAGRTKVTCKTKEGKEISFEIEIEPNGLVNVFGL